MQLAIILSFFLFGLIFGSFFNVVGLRLPKQIPFANDRSICPQCKKQLSWYENIPVVSFIIQGGKCRHCHQPISFIYPITEVITGIGFALSYAIFGWQIELAIALLFVSMLMIIFVADITYMLIPDKVLLFFLPLFIILRVVEPLVPWWSSIVGALVGTVLLAAIILISRGGMGAGDMKLFGLLGIVLGLKGVLLTFFLSCTIGAIIGIILLLSGKIDRKQPIPFGPYIVAASLITYFYGDNLINWYVTILL
ncbi:prepilin peptidase [Virgibacillus halodenitrificans]|uniref:Prepilin peptidase n=1 Tax=Virgibacillus halodenitrificans TaxID=1482 RepID=A0AAC9IYS7_VIRHA|nr:A24 family peptidase [Virgibacillus halodenitrificans]APC48028.1 prepilin peptidase [Virgibacillus halodenitrificans]